MSKPKAPSVETIIFENESEKIYFSFNLFKTGREKIPKDACLEDRFVFLLRQAYTSNKMLEFLKTFKAESIESVVTGVNFLIRYGISWAQYENKNLVKAFYEALDKLFIDDEGKYVPYAMYITKGLIEEEQKETLLIGVPAEVLEKYNKTKKLWESEKTGENK